MSLQKNFFYSSVLTVSKYLFPLVVYPYISRTLGVSNIGIVNFVDNIINYFIVVSMMGIMTVGVREIASNKDNKEQLSTTYISLLCLTAITTIVAIFVLLIAMYTVPTLTPYRDMLYIGIIKLIFNLFIIEWFYIGMEEFRYITIRSIVIKCLYVVCVFSFVHDATDYKSYYIISIATIIANALINIVYSRKFIRYSFRNIKLCPFWKSYFLLGFYVMTINVYSSLNIVWLGFVTNTDEVGYYTTATKLHTIIMAVLSSFTNILFPRVSHLLAEGKTTEYWEKIKKALDAVFLFSFPTMAFMLIAGPELLHMFVGDGFEGAYTPLRIITPLILIIGIEQIVVIQILMAMHKDNVVLKNCLGGAIASLIVNYILTAHLGASGSALVWLTAESVILVLSMIVVYKEYRFSLPYKRILSYIVTYSPLLLSHYIFNYLTNTYYTLAILILLTVIYAIVAEVFILKNNILPLVVAPLNKYIKSIPRK